VQSCWELVAQLELRPARPVFHWMPVDQVSPLLGCWKLVSVLASCNNSKSSMYPLSERVEHAERLYATCRKVPGSRPDESSEFFNIPNTSGHTRPSGSLSLYQKQKNNVSVSRARPVRRADNLAAICEPTVSTMWDPQHLTTL
jgi:hypothetical protein